MKALVFSCVLLLLSIPAVNAQKNYAKESDILDVKELTFYGYDFSDWRLAETKRIDEDVRTYIYSWIDMMKDRMTSEKLANWYVKDKVVLNFVPTVELAKKIVPETLVTVKKHYIRYDSLQSFINTYDLKEAEGIGLVMIVECFDKNTNRTSGYFTFFDIATKKILLADYIDQKEADGYGLKNFWGISLNGVSSNYAASYRKKLKAYKGR